MWFKLGGDARLGSCASEDCGGQPTWRLEAGGVGSNYCSGCKEKIDLAATVTVPKWALDFILEYGDFQDEGPAPEGWASAKMSKAMSALNDAIAAQS